MKSLECFSISLSVFHCRTIKYKSLPLICFRETFCFFFVLSQIDCFPSLKRCLYLSFTKPKVRYQTTFAFSFSPPFHPLKEMPSIFPPLFLISRRPSFENGRCGLFLRTSHLLCVLKSCQVMVREYHGVLFLVLIWRFSRDQSCASHHPTSHPNLEFRSVIRTFGEYTHMSNLL